MGKDLTFPSYWRLQAIGWLGLFPLLIAVGLTSGPLHLEMLGAIAIRLGTWFAVSHVLHQVCRSLFRRSLGWFQLELRAFGCSLLAGVSAAILLHIPAVFLRFHFLLGVVTRDSAQSSILLLLWCNVYFTIKQWQRSVQYHERLIRAESDTREARLRALGYQLNPHFLFNSLNAASTLAVEGDVVGTTRMLTQIADFLRTSLDRQLPFEIPLSEEMVSTERYLAIEQTRLGDRLQVDLAISAETLDAVVPSMLIQPLVENAIRHGIASVVEGGRIAISSERDGSQLRIVISNTGSRGVRSPKTTGGVGLANTMERLQTLYGSGQRLDLQWPETGGCDVRIEIPFRKSTDRAQGMICVY